MLSQSTRPTSGLVPCGSMAVLEGQIGESGLSAIQLTLLLNEIQKVLLKTQNLQQNALQSNLGFPLSNGLTLTKSTETNFPI